MAGRRPIIDSPSGIDGLTVGQLVVANIGRGLSHREACRASHIGIGTLTEWLYKGRLVMARLDAGDTLDEITADVHNAKVYGDFAAHVEEALAAARARLLTVVEGAAFEPQVIKRITRKLERNQAGNMIEVERTERVEEHPPRWAAAAWMLERRWPSEYGSRVQVTAGQEIDRDADARAFAAELRGFLEGAATAGQLAPVIEVDEASE